MWLLLEREKRPQSGGDRYRAQSGHNEQARLVQQVGQLWEKELDVDHDLGVCKIQASHIILSPYSTAAAANTGQRNETQGYRSVAADFDPNFERYGSEDLGSPNFPKLPRHASSHTFTTFPPPSTFSKLFSNFKSPPNKIHLLKYSSVPCSQTSPETATPLSIIDQDLSHSYYNLFRSLIAVLIKKRTNIVFFYQRYLFERFQRWHLVGKPVPYDIPSAKQARSRRPR